MYNNDQNDNQSYHQNTSYPEPEYTSHTQSNGYYAYEVSPKSTGRLSVASFVLGLIGFSTGIIIVGLVLDIIGIILGLVSLTSGRPKRSMAKLGIFISAASIVLTLATYFLIGQYMNTPYEYEPYEPTVQEVAASDELMENITYTDYDLGNGVLVIVDNDNSCDVDLDIRVTYYNESGDMISLSTDYLWGCAAGGRGAAQVSPPYNKKYEDIPYDSYEIDIYADGTDSSYYSRNYGPELEIQSNISSTDTVLATIKNPTGQTLDSVDLVCVYYSHGEPVGTSMQYLSDFGKKETVEFYPPYDSNYNDIPFDDYEIIVNTAQCYLE